MLDIIFGPLLDYGPLGTLNNTTISVPNADGTTSQQAAVWYNSQSSILFGDSSSWLIGLGRITNVFGPDLKVICDWTIALEWIPGLSQLSSKYPNFYGALMGTGGSTDFILGGKDLFNYGATTDFTFTRKKYPTIKVDKWKYKKDGAEWVKNKESYFPGVLKVAVFFPYLLLLSSVVTARLAYMQVGVFSNQAVRDQLQKLVIMLTPLIESRWIAAIKIIEQLIESKRLVEVLTKEAKVEAKEIKNGSVAILNDGAKFLASSPLLSEAGKESSIIADEGKQLLVKSKINIIEIVDQGIDAVNSLVGGITGLEDRRYDRESLSGNRLVSSASLQYQAESKIELKVHGKDTSAKIQMEKEEFASSVEITPVQVNTSTPIGSIRVGKDTKGVDISVNSEEAGSIIQLQHKGGDRSQLNIYPNSLEIQSGSKPLSAPSISSKTAQSCCELGFQMLGQKLRSLTIKL